MSTPRQSPVSIYSVWLFYQVYSVYSIPMSKVWACLDSHLFLFTVCDYSIRFTVYTVVFMRKFWPRPDFKVISKLDVSLYRQKEIESAREIRGKKTAPATDRKNRVKERAPATGRKIRVKERAIATDRKIRGKERSIATKTERQED